MTIPASMPPSRRRNRSGTNAAENPKQKIDMKKALRSWKISSTAKGFSNGFHREDDNIIGNSLPPTPKPPELLQ